MLRRVPSARTTRAFFIAAAFTVYGALFLVAQDGMTLRMDVKLVNVFVNVTDPNGAIVGGLYSAEACLYLAVRSSARRRW